MIAEHPETIDHLVVCCSQLVGQQCKTRHDHVARYLHVDSPAGVIAPILLRFYGNLITL